MNTQFRTLPSTGEPPRALYTAAQVRAFDRLAIENYGIAGVELMERAGQAAWSLLRERWPEARRILVLTGAGNNGGDGFVVARLAKAAGHEVRVVQLGARERLRGDALLNAQRWKSSQAPSAGVRVASFTCRPQPGGTTIGRCTVSTALDTP